MRCAAACGEGACCGLITQCYTRRFECEDLKCQARGLVGGVLAGGKGIFCRPVNTATFLGMLERLGARNGGRRERGSGLRGGW